MKVITLGLDIAKRVFQAHGVDAAGRAVLRRKLGRSEVADFFRALPGRHRGVRHRASLGARDRRARP